MNNSSAAQIFLRSGMPSPGLGFAPVPVRAFAQQRRQYTGSGSNLDTFLGTLFESLADQASFGMYQPDIISEQEEEAFNIAATLGHTAGSIGGFIASYALVGGVGGAALSAFKWGRAAIGAGKFVSATAKAGAATMGTTTLTGSLVRGISGISAPASIMATQEAAREFVRQFKENDPNVYAIGSKAMLGFMQGGMFGWMGEAVKYTEPVKRAIAQGSVFAAAEAMQLAHEGEDITKEHLGQAALMGASLSLIGARGWRQRRETALDEAARSIDSMKKLGSEVEQMEFFKKLVSEYKDEAALINISKTITMLKKAEVGKIFNVFETVRGGERPIGGYHKIIKGTQNKLNIADPEYRRMLGEVTQGRTTEGMELTKNEGARLFTMMIESSDEYIAKLPETKRAAVSSWLKSKAYKPLSESKATKVQTDLLDEIQKSLSLEGKYNRAMKYTKRQTAEIFDEMRDYAAAEYTRMVGETKFKDVPSGALSWARPWPEQLRLMGASDFMRPLTRSKRYMDAMVAQGRQFTQSSMQIFENEMNKGKGIGLGEKFGKGLKNRTPRAWTEVDRLMHIKNPNELTTELSKLTPRQQNVFHDFRATTKYFFERTNEALKAMGKKPFTGIDGYLTHVYTLMEKSGGVPEPMNIFQRGRGKPQFKQTGPNVLTKKRLPDEELREARRVIDPARMMETMIRYDLKTIYLSRPAELMKSKLQALYNAGDITKEQAAEFVKYVDFAILDLPTPSAQAWNKNVQKLLTQGNFGKAVSTVLAKFGREVGDRPVDAFQRIFSKAAQAGYIAFRPALGFRNAFQGLFPMGFTDTKTMAKAMGPMPERLKPFMEKNDVMLTSKRAWEIGITQDTQIQKAGALAAEASHLFSVDTAAKAGYWQYIDHVNHPNRKYNWGTEAGKKVRSLMKQQKQKGWREFLAPDEIQNMERHIEDMVINNEFLYHSTGQPPVFENPVAKVAFKFQSYPMNYILQYLPNVIKSGAHGSPSWDTAGKFKYTPWERAGLLRHFVFTGAILAGADAAFGGNFLDAIGIAYSPTLAKEERGLFGKGIVMGSFEMRPSMAVDTIIAIHNWMTKPEPYERKRAQKRLLNSIPALTTGAVVPGYTAAKEIRRTIKEGEAQYFAFRKIYTGKK